MLLVMLNPFHSIRTSSTPFSVRRSRIRLTASTFGRRERSGLRLAADGGGRRGWEVDGDSSSEESLRGRFLVRNDEMTQELGTP